MVFGRVTEKKKLSTREKVSYSIIGVSLTLVLGMLFKGIFLEPVPDVPLQPLNQAERNIDVVLSYEVNRDGKVHAIEKFIAFVGDEIPRKGIRRALSANALAFDTAAALPAAITIEPLSLTRVLGGFPKTLPVPEVIGEGGELVLPLGGDVEKLDAGIYTFDLEYTFAPGLIQASADGTREGLLFRVLGNLPITTEHFKVSFKLPNFIEQTTLDAAISMSPGLRFEDAAQSTKVTSTITYEEQTPTVTFESKKALPAGHPIIVRITWPKGFVLSGT